MLAGSRRMGGKTIMKEVIELTVNGESKEVLVRPYDLLVDVLRDEILLTGTKKGCGEGD